MNKKYVEALEFIRAAMAEAGAEDVYDLNRKQLNKIVDYVTDNIQTRSDADSDGGCIFPADESIPIIVFHNGEYGDDYTDCIRSIYVDVNQSLITIDLLDGLIAAEKNKAIKFVNLTPHAIVVGDTAIPSDGIVRVSEKTEVIDNINGVDITKRTMGNVQGLPESEDGVWYIVSLMVAQALPVRTDLLVPGEQIRDEAGRIVGCKNLVNPNV